MSEKWNMFKNYMHNELGITKEDIRDWIKEAVQEQAKAMVHNTYQKFEPEQIVKRLVESNDYFGETALKRNIAEIMAKQLLNNIEYKGELKVKGKS